MTSNVSSHRALLVECIGGVSVWAYYMARRLAVGSVTRALSNRLTFPRNMVGETPW